MQSLDPSIRTTEEALSDPEAWWNHYAGHYAGRDWRFYRPLLSEFVAWADSPPLLDVGCGYGFLLECARRFGIPAIGLEAGKAAIAACRKMHPGIDIREWWGGKPLPLESESIGGAVLNEFVDHITEDQNRLLFAELHRVLKPGGLVLVKSPSRFNRFDQDLGHVTFFSPGEFREFVQSFGFTVEHQPYQPQPLLGPSRGARLAMRSCGQVLPA